MAVAYRDPNIPPFGPLPLLLAYNACLPPHLQFTVGNFACAMEFLAATGGGGLLGHLHLVPNYMVTYIQEGMCHNCNAWYQQARIQIIQTDNINT